LVRLKQKDVAAFWQKDISRYIFLATREPSDGDFAIFDRIGNSSQLCYTALTLWWRISRSQLGYAKAEKEDGAFRSLLRDI
jgi:hypothetical protein